MWGMQWQKSRQEFNKREKESRVWSIPLKIRINFLIWKEQQALLVAYKQHWNLEVTISSNPRLVKSMIEGYNSYAIWKRKFGWKQLLKWAHCLVLNTFLLECLRTAIEIGATMALRIFVILWKYWEEEGDW